MTAFIMVFRNIYKMLNYYVVHLTLNVNYSSIKIKFKILSIKE